MSRERSEQGAIKIGRGAFVFAAVIILLLMVASGVLTRTVPPGSYEPVIEDGREKMVHGSFAYEDPVDYPVWRWFTAPVEVLSAFLARVVHRFRHRKYLLMTAIQFFRMCTAAVLGICESMVPLVVFIVPLSHRLGWDSLTASE